MRLFLILFAMIGVSGTMADETTPVVPQIRLPVLPPPAGPPVPQPVTVLAAESWYVIESDVPLIVLTSPAGLVSVTEDSGPLKMRGRFADGNGKIESRTYAGQYLFTVEAVSKGRVELLIVPIGVTSEASVIRRTLAVMGLGPQPPPFDDEDDTEPEPPKPVTVEHVSVAIVEDARNRSPETAKTMNAFVAWNQFAEQGHTYRLYDLTTNEPRGKQAITDLNGPAPGIVVYDRDAGTIIHTGKLPETFDALKSLISKLTGGA